MALPMFMWKREPQEMTNNGTKRHCSSKWRKTMKERPNRRKFQNEDQKEPENMSKAVIVRMLSETIVRFMIKA